MSKRKDGPHSRFRTGVRTQRTGEGDDRNRVRYSYDLRTTGLEFG